jgi:hypothetical protein
MHPIIMGSGLYPLPRFDGGAESGVFSFFANQAHEKAVAPSPSFRFIRFTV